MWFLLFFICNVVFGFNLGRESDLFTFLTQGGTEWVQVASPSGGLIWVRYNPFDTVLPMMLTETRFQIYTPLEGDSIIPDTITYINWKTYPRYGGHSPSDVHISLWAASGPGPNPGMGDLNVVSVVAHSVPNVGFWLWIARVPRFWSNDDWYLLRICSLEDIHECSDSNMFRIVNPYAFYP